MGCIRAHRFFLFLNSLSLAQIKNRFRCRLLEAPLKIQTFCCSKLFRQWQQPQQQQNGCSQVFGQLWLTDRLPKFDYIRHETHTNTHTHTLRGAAAGRAHNFNTYINFN